MSTQYKDVRLTEAKSDELRAALVAKDARRGVVKNRPNRDALATRAVEVTGRPDC